MAAILGLMDTETFSSERFTNVRRQVFYNYPAGAAPLTGLLSLLKEEETDDPKFSWWEKRLEEQWAATAAISSTIALYKAVTGLASTTYASGTGTWTTADGNLSLISGNVYGIKLANGGAEKFRPGHVIMVKLVDTSGDSVEVQGTIPENGVDGSNDRIAFRAIKAVNNIDYDSSSNVGVNVFVIGSAFYEGAVDISTGRYNKPIDIYNYTQIFKTPFTLSGTKMNTSVKFDDTGAYKDVAKEHSVKHFVEMEKAFLFGERSLDTSGERPISTTGGFLYFLRLWEAGSTYGNSASTSDSDDGKRIIANSDGTMTEKAYDGYLERVSRVSNNKTNERLVLCGSGFLNVINQLYKSKAALNADVPMKDTYGMDVVKHVSPFVTLWYKSHPLFSQHPTLRYSAMVVDIHNLVYRYLIGRDTELLKNRQANDADYRKDEWLSECGLEVRYPESHMFINNVTDIA